MSGKVGADDLVSAGANREAFEALPREDITPPLIHLVDIEQTQYVGRTVQTDIVIAGVGETFHVPRSMGRRVRETGVQAAPCRPRRRIRAGPAEMCGMSHDQLTGFMRRLAGCAHRSHRSRKPEPHPGVGQIRIA